MNHLCRTGHHTEPHYSCYAAHGCRCDGCRQAKVDRNRYDRWKGNLPDDGPEWMDQLRILDRISALEDELDRLRGRVGATVVRHTSCGCDKLEPELDVERLPGRLPAGPLADLVASRAVTISEQLPDEALRAAFYRGRERGWFTVDAADRLALALGHTMETVWPGTDREAA